MTRSLLFAPANREDLIGKLVRFRADAIVIDLEDGTPPSQKEAARAALGGNVQRLKSAGAQSRIFVRVNEPGSPLHEPDVAAALALPIDGVVIPKLENVDQLACALQILERAPESDATSPTILAGIESILGVIKVFDILSASERVTQLYFGAEDFMADMGGRRTAAGREVLYARSQVVLAAKAMGRIAIDQGSADIRDDEQFLRDANEGRDLGYDGKICVVPRQVELSHQVFTPTEAEVAYARELVATYLEAQGKGIGTIEFKGQMIDGPLLKRAQRMLRRAFTPA